MKLANAARYFDNDSIYDLDTEEFLFKGQFASYQAAKPNGSFQRRRILSVAPGIHLPVRRALLVHGEPWLAGNFANDGFFDKAIRQTTPCMLITDYYTVISPAQAALRQYSDLKVYAHTKYSGEEPDTRSSDSDPHFEVYIAGTETIPDGYFLKGEKDLLHIRAIYSVPEGYTVARSDQVEYRVGNRFIQDELWERNAQVDVTFIGAIDPMTEESTSSVETTGIFMGITKMFRMGTASSPVMQSGDRSLLVAMSEISPIAGADVRVETLNYKIYSWQPFHDAWMLHLKRL